MALPDLAVQLVEVSKYYGRKQALSSVSFSLKGGRVVFLGPNGSGKTTLMKIMAGLIVPDRGSVRIFDEPLLPGRESFRSRIGYLFDHSVHWEALTGWENAYFFARSFGMGRKESEERMSQLFERLNMTDVKDDPVSTYSYGMRRKLALIETMVHRPDILLLDEPSIGLDLSSRSALYGLLGEEAKRGSTVIISTNDINEARHIADEVLLILRGASSGVWHACRPDPGFGSEHDHRDRIGGPVNARSGQGSSEGHIGRFNRIGREALHPDTGAFRRGGGGAERGGQTSGGIEFQGTPDIGATTGTGRCLSKVH